MRSAVPFVACGGHKPSITASTAASSRRFGSPARITSHFSAASRRRSGWTGQSRSPARPACRFAVAAKIEPLDEHYYERVKPMLDQPGVEFVGEIGDKQKSDFL